MHIFLILRNIFFKAGWKFLSIPAIWAWNVSEMFLNKSSPNHHSEDSDVSMFVRQKKETNRHADPCAFKMEMESTAHKKCVIYHLYINMSAFVSLVVFWRYLLSKIVWFINTLFYIFLNLILAMFLTCFLFFCILSLMFLKIKNTGTLLLLTFCRRVSASFPFYQVHKILLML